MLACSATTGQITSDKGFVPKQTLCTALFCLLADSTQSLQQARTHHRGAQLVLCNGRFASFEHSVDMVELKHGAWRVKRSSIVEYRLDICGQRSWQRKRLLHMDLLDALCRLLGCMACMALSQRDRGSQVALPQIR